MPQHGGEGAGPATRIFLTSAFGPNAISIRGAISGDRPLRSFRKADNVCRVTPNALAAAVTLSASGRITSSRADRTACAVGPRVLRALPCPVSQRPAGGPPVAVGIL